MVRKPVVFSDSCHLPQLQRVQDSKKVKVEVDRRRGGSRGGGVRGFTPPPNYPADSKIWRKGVADRLDQIPRSAPEAGIYNSPNHPTVHKYVPRSRDLFIHMPSQLPGEHTVLLPSRHWKLPKHTEAFTVLPGTYLLLDRLSARVGRGLTQGHSATANSARPATRSFHVSLASCARYHCATTPHVSRDPDGSPCGIQIPTGRIHQLHKDIKRVLKRGFVTANVLAGACGQGMSTAKAVIPGKLLLRNAYGLLKQRDSRSDRLPLDNPARQDTTLLNPASVYATLLYVELNYTSRSGFAIHLPPGSHSNTDPLDT